jgi:hypothetical protein
MSVIILDGGNSIIKAKSPGGEVQFRHALAELTSAEWKKIAQHAQGKPPEGYILVNGTPYAYGTMAESRGAVTRRSGAARYTKDYYGVLAAIALSLLHPRRGARVMAFCSHAPRDVVYADDLISAALGEYTVEAQGRTLSFVIEAATTFDEPVGGLMNVILKPNGREYARTDINGGTSLVLDIGGHTTDMLSVAPGGKVDYAVNHSELVGFQQVERAFEEALRVRYSKAFKTTNELPAGRVREAITTGVYRGGGREYECQEEAQQAADILLSRIANAYQDQAGGPARWDNIILTGGGSAALHDRLVDVLDHGRVVMADPDPESIHFANVRGGLKLWRLYEHAGIV